MPVGSADRRGQTRVLKEGFFMMFRCADRIERDARASCPPVATDGSADWQYNQISSEKFGLLYVIICVMIKVLTHIYQIKQGGTA